MICGSHHCTCIIQLMIYQSCPKSEETSTFNECSCATKKGDMIYGRKIGTVELFDCQIK